MMLLTIDVEEYLRLPLDIRRRFDAWLDAESLTDKHIVKLTLEEGFVIVDRYKTGPDGRLLIVDDDLVAETTTYPVRALPPREAFAFAASRAGEGGS